MAAAPNLAAYLAALDHPHAVLVRRLTAALQAGGAQAQIKWNAPSFAPPGSTDRATFRCHPAPLCQMILHLGARAQTPAAPLSFAAPAGALIWRDHGRAVLDCTAWPEDVVLDTTRRWLTRFA